MQSIDRSFIIAAILFGLIGVVLGIVMGIEHDFLFAPIHAHINLIGWVSLALFGIAYRVRFARADGLAVVHFWVATSGTLIFSVGLYVAITRDQPALAIAGSLLILVSFILFLINVLRGPSSAVLPQD